MNNTKELTTSAIMAAMALFIAVILYYIPMPLYFLVAIPLAVVGILHGMKNQALALVACLAILALWDPMYSISLLFLVGPLSFIMSYCIKRKKPMSHGIFLGGLGVMFGMILLILTIQVTLDIDLIDNFKTLTDTTLDEVHDFYAESSILSDEEKMDLSVLIQDQKTAIKLMMPSFLFIFSLASSCLAMVFAKLIFKRTGIEMRVGSFKDFRINQDLRNIIFIVILVVAAGAFIDKANSDLYSTNAMILLLSLLQINGLSLIWYKTHGVMNGKGLRVIVIVAYIISGLLGSIGFMAKMALGVVGFLDMHLDFRKRKKSIQ